MGRGVLKPLAHQGGDGGHFGRHALQPRGKPTAAESLAQFWLQSQGVNAELQPRLCSLISLFWLSLDLDFFFPSALGAASCKDKRSPQSVLKLGENRLIRSQKPQSGTGERGNPHPSTQAGRPGCALSHPLGDAAAWKLEPQPQSEATLGNRVAVVAGLRPPTQRAAPFLGHSSTAISPEQDWGVQDKQEESGWLWEELLNLEIVTPFPEEELSGHKVTDTWNSMQGSVP